MHDKQDAAPQGDRGQGEDAQRFAQQLPDWISGHLPEEAAQWMAQMAAQHPEWAQDAQWMRALRSHVREHAQREPTDAAWALLQRRLQAEPPSAPERVLWQRRRQPAATLQPTARAWPRHRARLQRWWRNPVWGNALASLALVVVVGHTGWQLWQGAAGIEADAVAPAWRSGALEDLAPAPVLHRAAVQLPEGVSASQWHSTIAALGAGVQVQPLPDGRWLLQLPTTHTQAQWRAQLLAQPGMAAVQWQDGLGSPALP